MSIEEKVSNYKKTLEIFPNPQEKYQYLIEQAKKSDEFPIEDIANSQIDLMEEFELGVILSPARRNGAFSMLKTIREFALKLTD